ncbi:redox-regulated ATPase YchF [Patescibacteria group bacterium]|nr:redox-regulated ATPase YchF [Patescibacteria group bacterium]
MKLSIGIVGLPNVGKSTLFKALTRKDILIANYPFATIDPSVGVVAVPDPRLAVLTDISKSAKTVPAVVEFVDIAGLVKGASEGEGLGNQFLQNIRECDAIAEVVRIFEDGDITHVHGDIDPIKDIEVINLELILADLQSVSKRLQSVERDVKRGDKTARLEHEALTIVQQDLESGRFASRDIASLQLLTRKPIMYVFNKKAGGHNLDEMNDDRYTRLTEFVRGLGAPYVVVDAAIENELNEVSSDEKHTFRQEYGVLSDGIDDMIRTAYKLLGLQSYFTTGADETRAWTTKVGATAPEAGQAIHTDFKEKFIRAEVVAYDDLVSLGGFVKAREAGKVRTEGKEYIVQDGDVIEFKV